MPLELAQHLETAAERTFEQLGFLFSAPLEVPPEPPRVGARARILFRGVRQGSLELAVEKRVLDDLTRNLVGGGEEDDFLGVSDAMEPVDPVLEADCLKEAANVICGNVLAALAGEGEPWLLDAPELLPPGDLHVSPGAEECRLYLEVGEGWAGVRLSFHETACFLDTGAGA